jgi:hypothetical protein
MEGTIAFRPRPSSLCELSRAADVQATAFSFVNGCALLAHLAVKPFRCEALLFRAAHLIDMLPFSDEQDNVLETASLAVVTVVALCLSADDLPFAPGTEVGPLPFRADSIPSLILFLLAVSRSLCRSSW